MKGKVEGTALGQNENQEANYDKTKGRRWEMDWQRELWRKNATCFETGNR